MKKNKICIDCGIDFEKKNTDKGKINQCDDCSDMVDDFRYLGFNDGTLNKSTNISVYRGSDPMVRKKISNQKARTGI